MILVTTKQDSRGRITIPQEIREKLKIGKDDVLYLQCKKDHLRIYTQKSIKIKIS